jgi:hypothetical protein
MTKEERAAEREERRREREEREAAFPGVTLCVEEGLNDWVQFRITEGDDSGFYIRYRGKPWRAEGCPGKLAALEDQEAQVDCDGVYCVYGGLHISNLAALIAALISRYNELVRQANATALRSGPQPLLEIPGEIACPTTS